MPYPAVRGRPRAHDAPPARGTRVDDRGRCFAGARDSRRRRESLDEMLANLLDNACKWARSRVAISSSISSAGDDGRLFISVDDDGPGLDPSMRAHVLQRGVRADQQVRGSGLGLAIVSDLAELYGGSVTLETSPLGGTRARLELPRF